MIEKARERGIYDDLRVADLVATLSADRAQWDLIVACDTLVYVGDLRSVFAFAFQALRPGGWLIATVEAPEERESASTERPSEGRAWREISSTESASTEIELKKTRRFGHRERYLRKLADEVGYRCRGVVRGGLRREQGTPVEGIGFALERPRSGALDATGAE